jgi:uncharacterized protein YdeI (YjbR/CyaY-like superfamily)
MIPVFFSSQAEFRNWLAENHTTKTEILVGFYKVNNGKPSLTWSESVDQALCFGWIDGVRKSLDEESYTIRFTPRKSNSIWSAVNLKKMEALIKQGLMQEAGLKIYQKRRQEKSKIYAYENEPAKLSDNLEERLEANENAWTFFTRQASSYQKAIIYWIMSAKQQTTRTARLDKLINQGARGNEKIEIKIEGLTLTAYFLFFN